MADKRIIAVAGATGAQGGALVRAIQADPQGGFTARALTRNVNSEKARALAALGAEVVAANVDDPASLEKAFAGAYGAYCVTFFWDHFSPEREFQQAKNLAEAAGKARLQHVVWSTLEDTRRFVPLSDGRMPTLMGKYKVPHFDAKGEADALYLQGGFPATCLLTSFYWENFIYFGSGPAKAPDGRLALTLPMADRKLPGISTEDIGRCAYGILQRGAEFFGRTVGIAGEHLTGAEMAAAMTRALGCEVVYNYAPPEIYRTFGFPGAEDLANMFQFKRDFNAEFCAARSVEFSRSLNPALLSFDAWLRENAGRIPIG